MREAEENTAADPVAYQFTANLLPITDQAGAAGITTLKGNIADKLNTPRAQPAFNKRGHGCGIIPRPILAIKACRLSIHLHCSGRSWRLIAKVYFSLR